MEKFTDYLIETNEITKVVWGDDGRIGQGFFRKFADKLFNNKLNTPKFGKDSTKVNLKKAGFNPNEIEKIRKAVILGMEKTIKSHPVQGVFISDHGKDLFEKYSFFKEREYTGIEGFIIDELRLKAYTAAKENIDNELDSLSLKLIRK